MPAKTLGPKGGGLGDPTSIGEGNECHFGWGGERSILIRVWKPLPSRRILKTLRESSKGKQLPHLFTWSSINSLLVRQSRCFFLLKVGWMVLTD